MNPLGTRRAIDELARLLEGAVAGPHTPAAATAGTAVAMRVRAVRPSLADATTARPEFRSALRTRLLAVASIQAAQAAAAPLAPAASWARTPKVQRRMGVTAGAMAGVVIFAGVGVAGSRSVPGEVFYGLKTGAEGLQLDLAHGDTGRGSKHLEFAATRLREVRALASGAHQLSLGRGAAPYQAGGLASGDGRAATLRDTLARMDSQTRVGARLLTQVFRATGKQAPLHLLATFAASQRAGLDEVLPLVPPSAQASARSSLALVMAVGSDAGRLLALGACSTICDSPTGRPMLGGEPGTTLRPGGPGSSDSGVPSSSQGGPVPTTTPAPDGGRGLTGSGGGSGAPASGPHGAGPTSGPLPAPGSRGTSGPGAPATGRLPLPAGSPLIAPSGPLLPTLPVHPVPPTLPTLPVHPVQPTLPILPSPLLPTLPGPLLKGAVPAPTSPELPPDPLVGSHLPPLLR